MRYVRPLIASLTAIAVVGAFAIAEPATKPAKPVKVVQPWSKVADLSDEQKVQIASIHADMVAKQKAIEAEAKAKILALLTPEQKAQLDATLAEEAAERKAKEAERKKAKEGEPATKPAN